MPTPWKPYACVTPAKGRTGTCTALLKIHHVTHVQAALRILADSKIARGLIYDESKLNDTRTTVVWLSPNEWFYGSRYGNVQFTFDFVDIIANRKVYWVEVRNYNPPAYRFIISDQDLSHLPVLQYDATSEDGPLCYDEGVWYWNSNCTAEFLLDASLSLYQCKKVDFIKHHDKFCSLQGGCGDVGTNGDRAAGRVIGYVLSRDLPIIDEPLIVTNPKKALSAAAERGISRLCFGLGATSNKLEGPLKASATVDAALRAALLQFALGESNAAKETAALISSDDLFRERLAELVQDHFGLRSELLGT
jgi:hypothetical protein